MKHVLFSPLTRRGTTVAIARRTLAFTPLTHGKVEKQPIPRGSTVFIRSATLFPLDPSHEEMQEMQWSVKDWETSPSVRYYIEVFNFVRYVYWEPDETQQSFAWDVEQ